MRHLLLAILCFLPKTIQKGGYTTQGCFAKHSIVPWVLLADAMLRLQATSVRLFPNRQQLQFCGSSFMTACSHMHRNATTARENVNGQSQAYPHFAKQAFLKIVELCPGPDLDWSRKDPADL
jgi:hypothetical protein